MISFYVVLEYRFPGFSQKGNQKSLPAYYNCADLAQLLMDYSFRNLSHVRRKMAAKSYEKQTP